jgi:DNA (cytosine-5)-methyltransferase 1
MFRIIKELKPRWVIGENVRGITNIQDGMVFETVCTDLEGEGYEVRAFNIPAAGVGAPHRRERIWIVANARRTLRQGTELREKNEDETRKENADQHQRSSSPSKSNVANTNARLSDGTHEEVQSRGQTFDTSSQRTDVANTTSKGLERQFGSKLQGTRERFTHGSQTINGDVANANSQRQQEQCGTESVQKEGNESQCSSSQARHTGWESEPNVGRVAHGISGRVHRLKALGNSIVPKIAEEIGRAIMKAENEN